VSEIIEGMNREIIYPTGMLVLKLTERSAVLVPVQ